MELADAFDFLCAANDDTIAINFVQSVRNFLLKIPVANIMNFFRYVNQGIAVWIGTEIQSKVVDAGLRGHARVSSHHEQSHVPLSVVMRRILFRITWRRSVPARRGVSACDRS